MKLAGKVAIITAGSGPGTGSAVASAFLQEGARVVITYRRQEVLEQFMHSLKPQAGAVLALPGDVTQAATVRQCVRETLATFGQVDILVNNAGSFIYQPTMETSEEQWDMMMAINLTSTFLWSKEVLPLFLAQGSGRIINISSRAGLHGEANLAAYCASKAGVISLTQAMAAEVKKTNITINAVLPTIIDTPANRREMAGADYSTWIQPQEMAHLILFLASEESRSIHGSAIPIGGKV